MHWDFRQAVLCVGWVQNVKSTSHLISLNSYPDRCTILFHLSSTNVLIKWLGITVMLSGFAVVVPPFRFEVIYICIQSLQKLSVSLMRSLMRFSMDQRPGPGPQTDYEISYFPSQHGVFYYCAVRMLTTSFVIMSSTSVPQSSYNITQSGAR